MIGRLICALVGRCTYRQRSTGARFQTCRFCGVNKWRPMP